MRNRMPLVSLCLTAATLPCALSDCSGHVRAPGLRVTMQRHGLPPVALHCCAWTVSRTAAANQCFRMHSTDEGRTALHWAAAAGLTDVAEALLAEPSQAPPPAPMVPPANGGTPVTVLRMPSPAAASKPLTTAAGSPAAGAAQQAVVPPPLVELQDRQGLTALHLAARGRYPGVLAVLLAGPRFPRNGRGLLGDRMPGVHAGDEGRN